MMMQTECMPGHTPLNIPTLSGFCDLEKGIGNGLDQRIASVPKKKLIGGRSFPPAKPT